MIELTPLARPYAKAVFASALDTESIDEIKEELKTMALVSSTIEVKGLIEDPTLSNNEILNSLKTLLEGSISKTSQSLLNVLAENNRFNLLEAIFEIYKEIVAKHKEQNLLRFLSQPSLLAIQKKQLKQDLYPHMVKVQM